MVRFPDGDRPPPAWSGGPGHRQPIRSPIRSAAERCAPEAVPQPDFIDIEAHLAALDRLRFLATAGGFVLGVVAAAIVVALVGMLAR